MHCVYRQVMVTIITASLHISCGCGLAYSAILIPQLIEEQNSGSENHIKITPDQVKWITSVFTLSIPLGGVSSGIAMDAIGRLNALKLSIIPNVIGWVLLATATNSTMLIIGRLTTGFGFAWAAFPCMVYVAEISHSRIRGAMLCLPAAFNSVGIVLIYLKGWLLNWRLVAWLTCIYTIVPVIMIAFISESPSWLHAKGYTTKAKKAWEWFNKYKAEESDLQLQTFSEQSSKEVVSFKKKMSMYLKPTAYKPLLILMGLFTLQQFSGIYIIIFNGIIFFKSMGVNYDAYLSSMYIGIIRLVMTIINVWLFKVFNRRGLLILSGIGMCISLGISGLYVAWLQEETTTNSWVPVLMLVLYFVFASFGVMTIPFCIAGEVFPLAIRGTMYSLLQCMAFLLMFAALQMYDILIGAFGDTSKLLYFFAIISLAVSLFGFVYVPETQGRKLSDIEEYFNHHTTYLSFRSSER